MLAKSLDYDELENYQRWCELGNKPGKFKWQSLDHAGTRPLQTQLPPGGSTIDSRGGPKPPVFQVGVGIQAIEALANAQGRVVCYIYSDGRTIDRDGQPLSKTAEMIPYYIK